MASSFAKFQILGNVGNDPSVTDWQGNSKASLNLAVNRSWKDKDGNKQEKTSWIYCTAWRKAADLIAKYVKKGDKILVSGDLASAIISGDDDSQKTVYNFTIVEISLLGGRGGGKKSTSADDSGYNDGDIPF
jgi:single-strand DNA-binding protein